MQILGEPRTLLTEEVYDAIQRCITLASWGSYAYEDAARVAQEWLLEQEVD